MRTTRALTTIATMAVLLSAVLAAQDAGMRKWVKGKGWGWVWGPADEVGSLNEMTDASRLAALRLIKQGKVYDLGLPYDRESFKWVGHSAGEIISFRSPACARSRTCRSPPLEAATPAARPGTAT